MRALAEGGVAELFFAPRKVEMVWKALEHIFYAEFADLFKSSKIKLLAHLNRALGPKE